MAWPRCFPAIAPGSQFGPRIFKGNVTHHNGRDDPAGVGSWRLAPAAGVVLDHGQNVLFGFWIAVLYDGAQNPERMHQVQAGSRLPIGTRFVAGTPLAQVGHPHLWLPEAARRLMRDWAGGSKSSSTGPHSHQQIERGRLGGTPIDPAGAEAAADWARVIAHQTRPAATAAEPLTEEVNMPVIYAVNGSTVYAFDTATGKKRKLGATEWRIVRGAYAAAGQKVPVTNWPR